MTIRVSLYQKGKTNLDFTEARDSEWQWHQLGLQVCISLQTDNHASTPPLSFLQARCPFYRRTNSIKALNAFRQADNNNNPLLRQFDDTLRSGLITILNVDINNDQWLQASLPVGDGGLRIRSAEMLAPSAYLASAASTLQLHQSILPDSIWMQGDQSVASTEALWTGLANSAKPSQQTTHPESLGWTSCSKSKEPNPFQSSI